MELEEKVLKAQKDKNFCSELISEYKNYISSCANKATGRFVTQHDDEMSVAMIAFGEAIQKYETGKGTFLSFAFLTIKSRLIDYLRKDNKQTEAVCFSALAQTDKDGAETEFDLEDTAAENTDDKYEIEALKEELAQHGISFSDLVKASPKSQKTKAICFEVIQYILKNPILVEELKRNSSLPIKTILEHIKVNRKVLERHRKYIIAVSVILTGDYETVAGYFTQLKGWTV